MTELEQEYNYTPLAKPLRITEHNWPEGTVPLVTIRCTTYNHVNFIRDAIEGFLMQETTFPVEILIHDDASTDGTAEIVRDYEARYPQLIKAICQTENQYSKGNKPSQILRPLECGKYIAMCEGDDYWTDPRKLEIQVGYLENHPECVISGHDAFIVDEHGGKVSDSKLQDKFKFDFYAEELVFGRARILTMSRVYRNVALDMCIPELRYIKSGDIFYTSLLGKFGRSKYHHDIKPSCYRMHRDGVASMRPKGELIDDDINSFFWIYRYHKRVGNLVAAEVWRKRWQRALVPRINFFYYISSLLTDLKLVKIARLRLRLVFGDNPAGNPPEK